MAQQVAPRHPIVGGHFATSPSAIRCPEQIFNHFAEALQATALAVVLLLAPVGRCFAPVHCRLVPIFRGCTPLDGGVLSGLLSIQPGDFGLVQRLLALPEAM